MILRDDGVPFWRDIMLRAAGDEAHAEVADNVHHFTVEVQHALGLVKSVTGTAMRVPWTTCPGAIGQLAALVGSSVERGAGAGIDQTQQCTHLLDLARLAIAQVSRGGIRRYRCHVRFDPDRNGPVARLERDGDLLTEWVISDGVVISPGPFEGHDTRGRSAWSEKVLADTDLREAGLVMRRCVFIFRSRSYSAPRQSASDIQGLSGVCYSFQPDRAEAALRPAGFRELPKRPSATPASQR